MKIIATVGLLSLCAAGAYAQGTLAFYDSYGDLQFQVYAPQPSGVMQQGDTSDQLNTFENGGAGLTLPPGPVTYSGIPIGGSVDSSPSSTLPPGTINYSDGNDFTAQIYALSAGNPANSAAAPIPAFSSLLPVSQYVEQFQTSGGLANAFLNQYNPPGDPGVPGTGYDGSGLKSASGSHILNDAFVAVAAWYNAGGTITSLNTAIADNVPYGWSNVGLVQGLGEPASVLNSGEAGSHTASFPAEPYVGSFSLANPVSSTPEPGTIALGLMGVCGFLARRRKA